MDISEYIKTNTESVTELIKTLTTIPSPTFREADRAEFCLNWFHSHGMKDAFIDDAGNVIYELGDNNMPAVLILAHTDTVFSMDTNYEIKECDGKMYCPGIGDDTANVALMMFAAAYFAKKGVAQDRRIIFAADTCEEGLGNLKGCKALIERYKDNLSEVIALDGYMYTIKTECVGSHRYKITVKTPGGHSFFHFGRDNAIEIMARIINELSKIKLPETHITTYNFGMISGGTTVNSIAACVEMLYEYRSTRSENLEYMREKLENIMNIFSAKYDIDVQIVGERPCAKGVNEQKLEELIKRVEGMFDGLPSPDRSAGATDCNIPLSMGIPAVCVGLIRGGDLHSLNEYIEKDSIKDGFSIIMKLIASYYTK